MDLTFDEVASIYQKVARQKLPLSPEQVRDAMSAEQFVKGRRGIGGPQPEEMERMLKGQRERLESLRSWVHSERSRLASAEEQLEAAFARLL